MAVIGEDVSRIELCSADSCHMCAGDVTVSKAVPLTHIDPPKAPLQWWQEHGVVEPLHPCFRHESLQEPGPEDPVVDHDAMSREPPRCHGCGHQHHGVLLVGFRPPRVERPVPQKPKKSSPASTALR